MAVGRTPRNIAAKRDEVMRKFMSNLATNRVLGVFVAGVGCGVLAFCYSTILDIFIDLTWHVFPENLVRPALEKFGWPEKNAWMGGLWILTIPTLFGLIVGASQSVLGAPGDMPETVDSFNKNGYVDYTQVRVHQALCSEKAVCASRRAFTLSHALHKQSKPRTRPLRLYNTYIHCLYLTCRL